MKIAWGKSLKFFDLVLYVSLIVMLGSKYYYSHFNNTPVVKTQFKTHLTTTKEILGKDVVLYPTLINLTLTSSACTVFLKSSVESSFQKFTENYFAHHLDKNINDCKFALPNSIQGRIFELQNACALENPHGPLNISHLHDECFSALINFKSNITRKLIKEDAELNILPSSILLFILADRYNSGEFFDENSRTKEMIELVIKNHPDFLEIYQLKLLFFIFRQKQYDNNEKTYFDTKKKAYELLAAQSFLYETYHNDDLNSKEKKKIMLFGQSPNYNETKHNLDELILVYESGLFTPKHEQKPIKEIIEYLENKKKLDSNKDEWIYDYYLAMIEWDRGNGNYNKTLSRLEFALKKSPGNHRIISTLKQIKGEEKSLTDGPFSVGFNFNLRYY